ncbi:hypothetical protein HHK36_005790 [Tetracentron sinense]|uniref:Pentatricopeptide repeat-containing protein n=1 Tax=Tetracentron sinense TaxID=13715 RepID=A0A835DN61_TETSI|nr:hypothetical protein HHK36_005790 [Tetracentron sinense]
MHGAPIPSLSYPLHLPLHVNVAEKTLQIRLFAFSTVLWFVKALFFNLVLRISSLGGSGRSKKMVAAKRFFDQMPKKNEISWSALLNGYAENGDFKEALIIFCEMQALARDQPLETDQVSLAADSGYVSLRRL